MNKATSETINHRERATVANATNDLVFQKIPVDHNNPGERPNNYEWSGVNWNSRIIDRLVDIEEKKGTL